MNWRGLKVNDHDLFKLLSQYLVGVGENGLSPGLDSTKESLEYEAELSTTVTDVKVRTFLSYSNTETAASNPAW
jgi:hypothetical protein